MGIFDIFKERPEAQKARLPQEELQREESKLDAELTKVRFFSGSQAEYEACVGYQVRVIDTGRRDMGITFGMTNEDSTYELFRDFDFKKKLVEQSIEAIINCNYSLGGNNLRNYHIMYGLPVAKK